MKITVIGGGSYAWMPHLLPNFISNEFFTGVHICLMDINENALSDILAYTEKLKEARPGTGITFSTQTDLRKALDNADYVILAISQGGLKAELDDHVIARKYGHYNIKGSEVGIAGASRTLRHVRESVRIARLMETHCPGAMLLNVTNPLTAITRSVEKYTTIRAAGFCHGVNNHLQPLLPFIGCENKNELEFTVGGLDHCSFLLDLKYKGQDALQIMRKTGLIDKVLSGEKAAAYDDPFAGRENQRLRFLLWNIIGYLPSLSDEHCAEFYGQLVGTQELREHYKWSYDRIEERTKTVAHDKEHVLAMICGEHPVSLAPSSEIIDRFIQALHGGGAFVDVLNYRNIGQIPNLPMDTIVETKCLIDSVGVHPVMVGNLPPIVESIARPVAIREELFMQAGIEENVQKLKWALSTDPLVNEFRNIDALCDELMTYNLQF